MPSRKYQSVTLSSTEGYRYGFNGKEKDKDLNSLTAYDYGFRIYNPAIGKFLSVDPLTSIYTDLSPYQFSSDNPILFVDLDGSEGAVRDNFTGEIKPMRGDMSAYFSRPLFLYQPSTQQPVSTPPSQEKPIKVPVVQKVSSDYLAHVRTTQVQQTVAKVVIVPKKQSLNPAPRTESVQADTRNYYEKQLAKEFAEQVERTKFIGQTMQTPEGQGGMGLGLLMYSTARTPIGIGENAFGVYNGLREGNYWSAAKNFGFLLLDVSPFIKLPGASAAEAITIRSATGGAVAEMSLVRIISKGEKVEDIVNQAKVLTWQTGNEHALVKLASGERALVSGGPGGIYFKPDQIKLLFGHTHPTSAPPSDADMSALLNLGQSKQYVLHGGETSVVRPSLE